MLLDFFRHKHGASFRRCPLDQMQSGQCARIATIEGAGDARGRLCALGLTPGTIVEMCRHGLGHCCLKVHNAPLAVDSDLAARISCDIVSDESEVAAPEGFSEGFAADA